jgi:hypothetical protein
MRYALIVCSCLCVAAWMNVAAEAQTPSTTKKSRQTRQPKTKPPARAEAAEDKTVWPEKLVKGWGQKRPDAEEHALSKAQEWVGEFLSEKNPGITWTPPMSFIRKNLVKGDAQHLRDDDQETVPGRAEGHTECWAFTVAITRDTYQAMLRMEREHHLQVLRAEREIRMGERMGILGKLLMAVVALLAAVAGYLRLEDWTKGYYTWWLRAAVIGFLSFVALGLVFVA